MNLIYGFHGVVSLLTKNSQAIAMIYLDDKRHDKRSEDLLTLAQSKSIAIIRTTNQNLDKLSANANHQGIVATLNADTRPKAEDLDEFLARVSAKDKSLLVVLDGITDPQNLGAIIRTCECFGVDGIIIPKDNSAPVNALVAKISAGAINYLPVIVVNNLARALEKIKDQHYWIAGTSLSKKSVNLFEFKPDSKMVWVFGSEHDGIRRLVLEGCDYLVSIPMTGNTQSLNVSVATGVVLAYNQWQITK